MKADFDRLLRFLLWAALAVTAFFGLGLGLFLGQRGIFDVESGSGSGSSSWGWGRPSTKQRSAGAKGEREGKRDVPIDDGAASAPTSDRFAPPSSPGYLLPSQFDDESLSSPEADPLPPGRCGLYLAPSSLPRAGLGLFAGHPVPRGRSVNRYLGGTFESEEGGGGGDGRDDERNGARDRRPLWTDLFVPLYDERKSYPRRGQQRLPSWLGYVWPSEPGALTDLNGDQHPAVTEGFWGFDAGLDVADGLRFAVPSRRDLPSALEDWGYDWLAWLDDGADDDDDEEDEAWEASAFAPGIASLANHAPLRSGANLGRRPDRPEEEVDGRRGDVASRSDPGAGAFVGVHGRGVEFEAAREIAAGDELLLDFGAEWHARNDRRRKFLDEKEREEEAGSDGTGGSRRRRRERRGFVDGLDRKWDVLDRGEWAICPREVPTEEAKRSSRPSGQVAVYANAEDKPFDLSMYRTNDFHPLDDPSKAKSEDESGGEEGPNEEEGGSLKDAAKSRPLPWLEANGVCLSSSRLGVGPSRMNHAGRGIFANVSIKKGTAIITTPLLAMRREDFDVYDSDETLEGEGKILDEDAVVATELLYNYAYAHPDSPVHLVPTAPLANYLNHGGSPDLAAGTGANVEVRWPESGSNAAELFRWVYEQENGHYRDDFRRRGSSTAPPEDFRDGPLPWLDDHPVDVMERSGRLGWEYVALRDISPGEEILVDYGDAWDRAWREHRDADPRARGGFFRRPIGVPDGLCPTKWRNVTDRYEIAELADLERRPLEPGVAVPLTWAHNGKPLASKYLYAVGMEEGFSERFREHSEREGLVELYRRLLAEREDYVLEPNEWQVFQPQALVEGSNGSSPGGVSGKYFAHRYQASLTNNFNMHFVAAWDEQARTNVFQGLKQAGLGVALNALGERFGYDNMTCWHTSYMGMSHCDRSVMHTDIFATGDKSWNLAFPLVTVDGTEPELELVAEDLNTVVGVNYLNDVVYAMGDWGYHKSATVSYHGSEQDGGGGGNGVGTLPIRVVFAAYCSQIDETNVAMLRHHYQGEDPAPFADQFLELPMEVHWMKGGGCITEGQEGDHAAQCHIAEGGF
ncbi:hypothetical protein ACHAWF_010059 [Thalassiosira exigua]